MARVRKLPAIPSIGWDVDPKVAEILKPIKEYVEVMAQLYVTSELLEDTESSVVNRFTSYYTKDDFTNTSSGAADAGKGVLLDATGKIDISMIGMSGIIVMWSGSLASLPDGFLLCDGTSGTPDLRDKFILGCAAGVDPGGTGGASSHTHTVDPASVTSGAPSATTNVNAGATAVASSTHTHSVDVASTTSSSADNLPPYYKLAFIMKE